MKGQELNLGRLRTAAFLVAGALILSACSKKDESSDSTPTPPPAEIMYQATNVPVSTSCPTGGIYVDIGKDLNRNGLLDTNEIKRTDQVCNGRNGRNGRDSLIEVEDEPAGENCAAGGYKLRVATDTDGNGKLDDDEPNLQVKYLCHGVDGQDGQDGRDGRDGANGQDGVDGLTSLVTNEALIYGDDNCPTGGVRIRTGLDLDRNGQLAVPDEVQTTQYVCNGEKGEQGLDGMTSLVRTTVIEGPEVCLNGGVRIEYGLDDNSDGMLSTEEVDNFQNVCNGINGADGQNGIDGEDGQNALVKTVAVAPGAACAAGGTRVLYGRDANRNNVLEAGEESGSTLLCNGENGTDGQDGTDGVNGTDGLSTLVSLVTLAEGSEACANGGTQIVYGADSDRDGTLDESEIQGRQNVCNGADGQNGTDGRDGTNGTDGTDGQDGTAALVKTETFTSSVNCPSGGVLISHGQDLDNDQMLDTNEVLGSTEVCNGANGADGVDGQDGTNGQDGTDGQDGLNAVTDTQTVALGEEGCAAGGIKVLFGLDANRNGSLDAGEETSSQVLCNGRDGADGTDGADGADGLSTVIATEAKTADEECPTGGLWIYSGLDDNRNGVLDIETEKDATAYVCNGVAPEGVACYLQSYNNGSRYLQCGDDEPVLIEEGIDVVEVTIEAITGGYRIHDSWDSGAGYSTLEDSFRSYRNPHYVFDLLTDSTLAFDISSEPFGRVYIVDELGVVRSASTGVVRGSIQLPAGRYTAIAASNSEGQVAPFVLELTGGISRPQKIATQNIWIRTRWKEGFTQSAGTEPHQLSMRNPWFRFSVSQRDYVEFDIDANFTPRVFLIDEANNNLLVSFESRNHVEKLEAGDYQLVLSANATDQEGTLRLVGPVTGLEQINPDIQAFTGRFDYAGESNFESYRNDHYRFSVSEPTHFDLLYTSTVRSNYVELGDGTGYEIARISNQDQKATLGPRLLQPGNYELVVGTLSQALTDADYTLQLFGLEDPVARVSVQKYEVSGTWASGGDSWFEYQITLSERSAIDMLVLDSSSTHPRYQLLDETGLERIPEKNFGGSSSQLVNHLVTNELPAGTYTLRLKSANNYGGRFDLKVMGLISDFQDVTPQ